MKYLLSIPFLAVAAIALTGCNDIKDSDRLIELPAVGTTSRVVLLEEFTGQYCPNCPDAHEIVAKLSEQYPDNFIPVAIHGGDMAIPVDDDGLATPDGYAYVDHWGVTTYPSGVLNRATSPISRTEWASTLREMVQTPTWLKIDLKAVCDEDGENITITTDLFPEMTASGKLQLWLVEDFVIAYQSDSANGPQLAYRHDHVYRANINGLWGEDLNLTADEPLSLSHTFAIPVDDVEWDPDYLSVVAFFYTPSGVVQAAHSALQPE